MRKPARQGSELANKGAYIDVSDRSLQAKLTQEAKITSASFLSEVIFAFGGFVSGLKSARTVLFRDRPRAFLCFGLAFQRLRMSTPTALNARKAAALTTTTHAPAGMFS